MPRTVLENLMQRIVPIAERILEKEGTFVPYGAALSKEEEVELAGGDPDREYRSSGEVIEAVLEQLRAFAADGRHVAVAMVLDVRVTPPQNEEETDAIRVFLEHETGLNIEAFIPYVKKDGAAVEYGEMFAFPGKARIFTK
jgi:hypothetical protein